MQYKIIKNKNKIKRKIIDFENIDINSINFSNKLDFKTVKLSDIISFSMGNTPKKVDDNYNGDIPWITISNLKNKYINHYTAFVKNSKSVKIIPKDTLIGSFKMSVGRFGFTTEDCCTNEAIIAIRKEDTKENLDYLYYLLPRYFNDNAEKNGQGIPLLNSKKIKDIRVDIPKLEEQNKIVKMLEKQESVISNIEKLILKTEKMFEYFCDKEFDLKDIEKNNYKIKDIIIKNPKSTIKAGDIKASTGNIPAFNSSAKLQYFYDDYLVDGENIFLPTGGSASIHYYNGKSCYTTDVFSFRTEKDKVINKYMYYYFKNDLSILDNMFYGAGLKHLNKNELLNYKISIPSLEKQKETVKLLEKQEILIENQKKLLEKEKEKFKWLSEKLLSGEYLVVEDKE